MRLEERRAVAQPKKGRRVKDIDSSDDEAKSPSKSKVQYLQSPPTTLTEGSGVGDSNVNQEATDTDAGNDCDHEVN